MILPGMTAVFVDDVLIRQFEGWLGPLLIGLGATFLLNVALRSLQELALLRIELRLALEQSALFIWHVLTFPSVLRSALCAATWSAGSKPTTAWRRCWPGLRQCGGELPDGGVPRHRHGLLRRDAGVDRHGGATVNICLCVLQRP